MRIHRSSGATSRRHCHRRTAALLAAGPMMLALAGTLPLSAHAASYTPADPESGRVALSQVIKKPSNTRWANGDATVNCQALVTRKGRVAGAKCGLQEGIKGSTSKSVLGATYVGLKRAKFKPATMDGDAVDVVMSVRVAVRCIGEKCRTSVYPNLGLYTKEYGNDYVAPQEILTSQKTWYERMLQSDVCADGGELKEACVDDGAFRLVMYVDVDDAGKATKVVYRRNPLSGDADTIMEQAEQAATESLYMPGLVDGDPAPMTVLSSSLHYDTNRSIPKSICIEEEELGSRLARKKCYNPQQHARVAPSLQIYSWLPLTTGTINGNDI